MAEHSADDEPAKREKGLQSSEASPSSQQANGVASAPIAGATASVLGRVKTLVKFRPEILAMVAFISLCLYFLSLVLKDEDPEKRILTPELLAEFNGVGAPLYMAILGEVYDVTAGKQHYGAGGGYNHFVGRDASRAFITGNWEQDLTDHVSDFTAEQCAGLVHWRNFYRSHKEYKFRGRLVGRFYNMHRQPRPALLKVEKLAAEAKTAEQRQKELEAQWPNCNARWNSVEGGVVWCDGGLYPRKVFTQLLAGAGEPTTRCACFKDYGWSDVRQVYAGCQPLDHQCQVSAPEQQQQQQSHEHKEGSIQQQQQQAAAHEADRSEL